LETTSQTLYSKECFTDAWEHEIFYIQSSFVFTILRKNNKPFE